MTDFLIIQLNLPRSEKGRKFVFLYFCSFWLWVVELQHWHSVFYVGAVADEHRSGESEKRKAEHAGGNCLAAREVEVVTHPAAGDDKIDREKHQNTKYYFVVRRRHG